jgi:membrane protease YdiL (CAAX protease family)
MSCLSRKKSMNKLAMPRTSVLTKSIQGHPVAVFFTLTFVLSWTIWFLTPALSGKDHNVFTTLISIGAYGPAFAAWFVAARMNPEPVRASFSSRIVLFILTYPVTFAIWWFGRRIGLELTPSLHWTDFVLAALPALLVSGFASGKQGVRDWLASLRKWRIGLGLYLLTFLAWPALIAAGNALARLLGFSLPPAPYSLSWSLLWLVPLNLLNILFYTGGNEEPGWRGFAQPVLQKKYSPLAAGLIIGAVWGLWHVPLSLIDESYIGGVAGLWVRVFELPYGVFFAWLYNRSRGSLIPVWLMHGMSNNMAEFLPRAKIPVFTLGCVLLILLVIKDRMWKRQAQPENVEIDVGERAIYVGR